MTLEEALKTSLAYEQKIQKHYADGAAKIKDPAGKRAFAILAVEEQSHVEFLQARLTELAAKGNASVTPLRSKLPSGTRVSRAIREHKKLASKGVADKQELDLLKVALSLEQQTSAFYRRLGNELRSQDSAIFDPFLNIEDGHVAVVQAEIDALTGVGFWFDMPEFSLEAQ